MKIAAHPIQQAILDLVSKNDIAFNELSLRAIAEKVGDNQNGAQKVKHHITQMVKYGFLDVIEGKYKVGKIMNK